MYQQTLPALLANISNKKHQPGLHKPDQAPARVHFCMTWHVTCLRYFSAASMLSLFQDFFVSLVSVPLIGVPAALNKFFSGIFIFLRDHLCSTDNQLEL